MTTTIAAGKITNATRKAAATAVKARVDARKADLAPVIAEMQRAGITTLRALASALSHRGIPTARGGSQWRPMQVARVLKQIGP